MRMRRRRGRRRIRMRMRIQDHIIYLKASPFLTKVENEEAVEIIQDLKQLIYRSRMDERQVDDPVRINAHIRKCIQQIVKLRRCNSESFQLSEKLIEENDFRTY